MKPNFRIGVRYLALLALLSGFACDHPPAKSAQWWTVPVPIGTKTFALEVASTQEAQRTGLMFRKTMAADHGMIFVFGEESPREFWMDNTYLPLDILYLDRTGKVVSIHPLEPLNKTPVPSGGPAMFAIELNRGAAADAGIKPGDSVSLPERVREIAGSPAH